MLLKESGLFASTESMVTFIVPFMVFASTEPDTLVRVILPLWLLTSSSPLTPSTAISPFVLRRVSDVSGGTEITSSPRCGRCMRTATTFFSSSTERPRGGRSSRRMPSGVLSVSRSEEHTSELQSLRHLVCRLLLEKKKEKH